MIDEFWGPLDLIESLTSVEEERLYAGRAISRGHKIYMVCPKCLRLIRTNGFFGSMHVCKETPR